MSVLVTVHLAKIEWKISRNFEKEKNKQKINLLGVMLATLSLPFRCKTVLLINNKRCICVWTVVQGFVSVTDWPVANLLFFCSPERHLSM